ncbi:MAG: transglutaminase family protein [Planctomycetota bacterium]|nr:transglutaminase family protein [Planctomycetota bacterium]
MTTPQGVPEGRRPTPAQLAAAIVLLGDDRGPIQAAASARLLRWGEAARKSLHDAAEAEAVLLRMRARALLRALDMQKDLRRFAELRLGRGGRGSAPALLEGAVLLTQMVRTFVPDTAELASRLRREANTLRGEFAGRSLPTCARLLAQRLHGELRLAGGDASGPEPDLSSLDRVSVDRVLDLRTGVPVALSLIYLLVARWAGLSAAGVAMPDHFLVRLHGVRPVLVDPFHGGRAVTKVDCARHLRAGGHEQVREHLRDLTDREVLIHYLRGLQRAAAHRAVPETQKTLGHALLLLETS